MWASQRGAALGRAGVIAHGRNKVWLPALEARLLVERGPEGAVRTLAATALHATPALPTHVLEEGDVGAVGALLALAVVVVGVGVGPGPLEVHAVKLAHVQAVWRKVVLCARERLHNVAALPAHVEGVNVATGLAQLVVAQRGLVAVGAVLEGAAELRRVDGELQVKVVVGGRAREVARAVEALVRLVCGIDGDGLVVHGAVEARRRLSTLHVDRAVGEARVAVGGVVRDGEVRVLAEHAQRVEIKDLHLRVLLKQVPARVLPRAH